MNVKKFEGIGIGDNERHAIANGIFSAITCDIPEIIQEHNLPTSYGAGQFRWNFINRNVMKNLDGLFQHSIKKCGPFPCLLLYDKVTELTFSIMSERNFAKLQRHLPKNPHYMEGLIVNNSGYEIIEGQISLDDSHLPVRDKTALEALRDQLLSDFTGIIKNHILILFEYSYSRVISARAVLVTPEWGIAFSEDWSDYLDTPYVIGQKSLMEELNSLDDDEPLVHLKDLTVKDTDNQLIAIPEKPDAANS